MNFRILFRTDLTVALFRAANIVIVPHCRRRCDAANRIGGLDAMAVVHRRIDAAS